MSEGTEENILKENTELGEALDTINQPKKLRKLSRISREQHGALLSCLSFNEMNILPIDDPDSGLPMFNIARVFMETSISVDGLGRTQHTEMVRGHQDTKKNNIFSGLMQRQP